MHLPRIRSSSIALHQSEHLDKLTAINAFGCDLARLSLEASRSPEGAGAIIGGVMKILMVLTSHDRLGDTGKKTGFWLEEFAAPYYVFRDAGADITLASPKGGQPPVDPRSEEPAAQTPATNRLKQDKAAQALLADTARLSTVAADDHDAVFHPGGHGPCRIWPRIASPSG